MIFQSKQKQISSNESIQPSQSDTMLQFQSFSFFSSVFMVTPRNRHQNSMKTFDINSLKWFNMIVHLNLEKSTEFERRICRRISDDIYINCTCTVNLLRNIRKVFRNFRFNKIGHKRLFSARALQFIFSVALKVN